MPIASELVELKVKCQVRLGARRPFDCRQRPPYITSHLYTEHLADMAGVQSPPPQPYYGGAMSPPQMQAFSPYPPGSPMPAIRPGTLPPGTAVKIGDYAVVVQRFLSEGGFAHVYLVNSDRPIYGLSQHVLKRVAVPDKDTLKEVRWEVDVMVSP